MQHTPSQLLGILGHPLGHSLSPLLHNWTAKQCGLPRVYMKWDKKPDEAAAVLDAVRALPIHGLSVTIPYKQMVMQSVDAVEPAAKAVGAANTLFWHDDRLVADNTDVAGFLAGLDMGHLPQSALILGAGGAARAVACGLKQIGVSRRYISNRNASKAQALAQEFSLEVVAWEERIEIKPDLIVNTTPLGMAGELAGQSPWPADAFTAKMTAYDLVYNPMKTKFLQNAQNLGAKVVDGLTMFLGQAAAQHARWTPQGPPMPMGMAREVLLQALSA